MRPDIGTPPASWRCRFATALCLITAAIAAPRFVRADAVDDYNVAQKFFEQERWEASARSFREFLTRYGEHRLAPSAKLFLGQALINQRKFDEARDVYRAYVRVHNDRPEAALAQFRAGESSYFLDDNEAARQEMSQFLRQHAGHELELRARQYLGQVQLRLDDPAAAASMLQTVVDNTDDEALKAEAQFGLARAFDGLGRTDRAAELFAELASDAEGAFAADAQFRLGAVRFAAKDYAAAEKEFAAVSTRFPGHNLIPTAELNAGYAAYYLDDMPTAVVHFEKARTEPTLAATAGFWIGLSQKRTGDYAAASETLGQLYEANPDDESAEKVLFHWADSQLRAEAYARAQELFALVVSRWPAGERADDSLHLATEAALRGGDVSAAAELNAQFQRDYATSGLRLLQELLAGRIELALGDQVRDSDADEARAHFTNAAAVFARVLNSTELDRTRALARVQLSRVYQRLEQPEQVVEALEPLLEEFRSGAGDPEIADSLLVLAETFEQLGRHDDVIATCDVYLNAGKPADAMTAWSLRALAHTRQQKGDEALGDLDRLAALDGSAEQHPRAAYACAEAAYAAENWGLAEQLYDRVVSVGDATVHKLAALTGLGYSRHEAGRHEQAAEAFEQIVADPSAEPPLAATAAHMAGLSRQLAGEHAAAVTAYRTGHERFSLAGVTSPSPEQLETGLHAYQCAKGAARVLRESGTTQEADDAYRLAYEELLRQPPTQQGELDKLINEWALLSYEAEAYDRSDELFRLLIEQRPESDLADDARLYLGESHFFAQRYPEARKAFEDLQKDEQADAFVRERSLVLLLDICAELEDWQALETYAEQLTRDFDMSGHRWYAAYRAGQAALELGEAEQAAAALQPLVADDVPAAIREQDWHTSVWLLLAEAALQQKKYEDVDTIIAAFHVEHPQSPFAYQADEIQGRSFKNRAMFPEAREAFRKVVDSEVGRRTETAAKAQLNIAETYLMEKKEGSLDAALSEYYKVYVNYQFPQWQAPALFQAGQCDEQLKNWQGALKSYEALIAEFPESEFAERAKPRLEIVRGKLNSNDGT